MKVSVAMAFSESTEPGFIKEAVQMAEAKGVYGIWVPEHVFVFLTVRDLSVFRGRSLARRP